MIFTILAQLGTKLTCLIWILAVLPGLGDPPDPSGKASVVELSDPRANWHGVANAEYKGGGDRNIGQLGFTLPLQQDENSLLFFDFRGRLDDNDYSEFNLGLAYRTILPSGNWIAGAYAFYDYKNSEFNNDFDQLTIGAELLSELWDFRVNGYIPESDPKSSAAASSFSIVGSDIFLTGAAEAAYYGFDYEVGRQVLQWGEKGNEIRGYFGGYYFDNDSNGFAHVAGPRVRAELRLFDVSLLGEGSRLTFSGEYQWDEPRGSQGFGGLHMQIPLGRGAKSGESYSVSLSPLKRRMLDPIVRDIDIVTQNSGIEKVDTVGGGGAKVTTDDMTAQEAVALAGETGLVVVNGEIETGDSIALKKGQRITGGDSMVTLVGKTSGVTVTKRLPGNSGTIRGTNSSNPILVLADDVSIDHLDLLGGLHGISGSGSGVTIDDNFIYGAESDGINISGTFNGVLSNNISMNNGDDGFDFNDDVTGTIIGNFAIGNEGDGFDIAGDNKGTIRDNFSIDNEFDGFQIEGNNSGTISGNTAIGNDEDGFYIGGDNSGTISANLARGSGDEGFDIDGDNTGFIIGNTASSSVDDGFDLEGDNAGTIRDNLSTGSGDDGFDFFGENRGTIADNIARDNGDDGFDITGDNTSTGIISGNIATGNGDDGFDLLGDNRGTIRGNTAEDNDDDGFDFTGVNSGTIRSNTATGNAASGFFFRDDNTGTISANLAVDNDDEGFLIDGTNTGTISANTARSNGNNGFAASADGDIDNQGEMSDNVSKNNTDQGYRVNTNGAGTSSNNTGSGNAGTDNLPDVP